MKHTSKPFRKESKKKDSIIRKGYQNALGMTEGKTKYKESKKEQKKTHEEFKKIGGTRHQRAYKSK